MKPLQKWLDEYAQDHQNKTNKILHKICVPVIFGTVAGVIHLIPYGDYFAGLIILTYMRWGFRAFAIMLAHWVVSLAITNAIQNAAGDITIWILLGLFAIAWVGQFVGHHYEGRRPSFFTDLQYLLIGPLWIWLGH